MAFKSKAKADSSNLNLEEYLENKYNQVSNKLTQTQLFETDSKWFPAATDSLKKAADLVGFKDYDPAKVSSFMYVRKDSGFDYIAGPVVGSVGPRVVMRWGMALIDIDGELSVMSAPWRFYTQSKDKPARLILDSKGVRLPVSLRLKYVEDEEERKEFLENLQEVETFADLAAFLDSVIPVQPIKELMQEGEIAQITSLVNKIEKKDKSGFFGIIEGTLPSGQVFRTYTVGEIEFWSDTSYPVKMTRNSEHTVNCESIDSGTHEFSLGRKYTKLSELVEGESYKVVAYEVDTKGKFGPRAQLHTMVNGKLEFVSANTKLNRLLIGSDIVISEESPATLHIDNIRAMKNGNMTASVRLEIAQDDSDPFMAQLAEMQAQLAS